MAKSTIHNWRRTGTFMNSRCTVSYAEVEGERVRCLKFDIRRGPTHPWEHRDTVYHLVNRKAGDRFMCTEEFRVAAMVAAFKAGVKSWKL